MAGKPTYKELEQKVKDLELALSEHKQAEEVLRQKEAALQKAHNELEGRVQKRTAELDKTNTQLKQELESRKRTEQALRASEDKYRVLIENLPGVVFRGYSDCSVEFIDEKIEVLTGYDVDEFNSRKMKWSDIVVKEDLETATKIFVQALKTDKSYVREYRIKSKSGKPHWIQERGQIVCDNSGRIESIDGVFFNITDRKQAEKEKSNLQAQLQQAQKMEAIGTLAGGIAHDFNNILQAISGYTEILLMGKEESDPDHAKLTIIEKAALRASDLTKRLLIFARKVEIKLRPVDLNDEITQVYKLLNRIIPKMVTIELQLSNNLKVINADPLQLEQIILNIGINARDAMPDGGKLIVETKNVILDELYCKTHLGSTPGEYVLLTVSDTGHGMEKEILEHIFEPFFTTKESGKGTGLGMAMVYSIVKSHGGYITCYSEPSQGTAFKIYFPVLKHGELELGKEQREDEKIIGGSETILIVDDEETILNFGHEILERYGYAIIKAGSGEEAIELYKAEKKNIDLVILDMGMPGMGGHQCLRQLFQIDPQVKIIISSGYPATGKVRETLESGAAGFIGKPFQVRDVLKIIRKVLDKNPIT